MKGANSLKSLKGKLQDPLPKDGTTNRFEVLLEEGEANLGQEDETRISSKGTEEESSNSSRENDAPMGSEETEEADISQTYERGEKDLATLNGICKGTQMGKHRDSKIPDLNKVPSSKELVIEHNRQEKEKQKARRKEKKCETRRRRAERAQDSHRTHTDDEAAESGGGEYSEEEITPRTNRLWWKSGEKKQKGEGGVSRWGVSKWNKKRSFLGIPLYF
ncbi:hypothetical protein R1flu_007037 [Riccia fluitans]|uniref:Uncharacterized protein n=1 Tax=Riccia fluitans TaxID=41844 RepID=A0ABD1YYH8_9MARC